MENPTVQAAKKLFQKLVETRLSAAPIPQGDQRIYPVAALPNGRLLLSDGNIRQTPVMQNVQNMKEKQAFEGSQESPADYLTSLAFNIAVPAQETGKNIGGRAVAFTNYLNSILKPKLASPQETGLPAIVPQMQQVEQTGAFTIPSAIANLPKLAPETPQYNENKFFENFAKSSEGFMDALKKDFAKITSGEQEANQARGFGNLPLVQGYGTAYRLPTQENAQYAQISANPFALTDRVR